MKLLVLNGPNLNFLGIREPALYGTESYTDLVCYIEREAKAMQLEVEIFQSNHEGALIDKIQEAYQKMDGIIINPAAYTHTSIAILDALKAVGLPAVEVHMTDIMEREAFRRISYAGLACKAHFIGMGFEGYKAAMQWFCDGEQEKNTKNFTPDAELFSENSNADEEMESLTEEEYMDMNCPHCGEILSFTGKEKVKGKLICPWCQNDIGDRQT